MALVLGVGIGIFTLALVWVFSLLVCVTFSRAQGSLAYAGFACILLSGLLTLILVLLPREPKVPSAEEVAKVYDYSIIWRSLLIAGCALFLLIGLIVYLTMHVMEPIYAKPLRRIRT